MNAPRIVLLPSPAVPISSATVSPLTPYTPQIGLCQSETHLCAVDTEVADLDQEVTIETNPPSTLSSSSLCSIKELPPTEDTKVDIDAVLSQYGYKHIRKMSNTLQGAMYEATIVDPMHRQSEGVTRVAIKQTSKSQHRKNEAMQDGFSVIVEENIVKEAIILKHLTKDNRPNGGYIARFIDFFETDYHFYLVTEYVGDCNLTQFVRQCRRFIRDGKMKLSDYKAVVKFMFWQIAIVIHWMHKDMKCCHLDLCLENIIVQDCNFITNDMMQTVSIDPNIGLKLVDFGLAEIFHPAASSFCIEKFGLKDSFETSAPQVYGEIMFDGMKADIWSLGVILYKLSTGKALYRTPQDIDDGFCSIVRHELRMHIESEGLVKCFNKKSFELMTSMLRVDEGKRYCALNILQSAWFDTYYKRYASRIANKSKSQRKQLKSQLAGNQMMPLPYYRSNV